MRSVVQSVEQRLLRRVDDRSLSRNTNRTYVLQRVVSGYALDDRNESADKSRTGRSGKAGDTGSADGE